LLAITTKSSYAVRALAELARAGSAVPIPIGELARRREIPVQFLEGLFATLRRAGILQSQRGVKGGYSFGKPPGEITVLAVVEALEGELNAATFDPAPIWSDALGALKGVLAGTTIAELAEREAREAGTQMYYI
jgi:Rrf2 family transcriptional regulator, cysteine metabolism repressor